MNDIRLETMPYEFNGKTYQLCCNYNVLADLTEEFGGLPNLFDTKKVLKYYPAFIAAMMNDYADSMEWPERFTTREIGRTLDFKNLPRDEIQKVVNLVINSLYEKKEDSEEPETNNDPKN